MIPYVNGRPKGLQENSFTVARHGWSEDAWTPVMHPSQFPRHASSEMSGAEQGGAKLEATRPGLSLGNQDQP